MTENSQIQAQKTWDLIGGPEGGSVFALTLAKYDEYLALAATGIGVFTSTGSEQNVGKIWKRLADSPGKTMAIAISPNFQTDRLIVAGNRSGIYISTDAGISWQGAEMPRTTSAIQALVFSPDFLRDGIIMAGTEEDGVFISEDRGRRWVTRNFGFLDACVFCLAFSPSFARDEIAFAGTSTGLYRTINGGRAWREVSFPSETGPILSLGISPFFSQDGTVIAGTEEAGLLYSNDKGKTWRSLETPGTMVNAVQISQHYDKNKNVFIATENGIFLSEDNGDHWRILLEVEGVLSLAAMDHVVIAGLIDLGVYHSHDLVTWTPATIFYARELSGFRLSPAFEQDHIAFSCGIGEGIWRTSNGGRRWECLNEEIPGTGISEIVCAPAFHTNHLVYAASIDGVLISRDGGDHWDTCYSEPINHLAISPSGRTLMGGTEGQGVVISHDSGLHWTSLAGPWEYEGDIQAVALGSDNQFFIASIDPVSHQLVLGYGRPGQWRRILSQPSSGELVSFYIPTSFSADNLWYAATGSKVWRVGLRKDADQEGLPIRGGPVAQKEPNILSLTGTQSINNRLLLALTGQAVYRSGDGIDWRQILNFGSYRMISMMLSPAYKDTKTVYSFSLGGLMWKGNIT
jgi:photosystem II stability/assembly factor-like uncharacterized protein